MMEPIDVTVWKNSFFKDNFTVDECLIEYTKKSDLETLRKDLKSYGAELQLHMSDILKNETEAIVNLAEYLTNLNSKIDDLSVPISQLKEEVLVLYNLIKSAESKYEVILGNIKNNNSKQNHIHLKLGILNSTLYINLVISTIEADIIKNLLTLERMVNKFSFQKNYLEELNLMTFDTQKIVNSVESKLMVNLNNCFLHALRCEDKDILIRALRMYVDLQKCDEAHEICQTQILKPVLQDVLSERYLGLCNQDLDKVYTKVKEILDMKVDFLSEIVQEHADLNCFNFVLKSFWKEFDRQSRVGLPHITAPGNPELFQKRFTCTYNLLKHIANKAGDEQLIIKDEEFQNHLKRFNLPVYFEIKFQQIAGNFESSTIDLSLKNVMADSNKHSFQLKPSVILWEGLENCFHDDVFIDQLADYFIRLSMMLLSRYVLLLEQLLKKLSLPVITKEDADCFIVNVLIDLSIVEGLVALKCNHQDVNKVKETIYSALNSNMWPTVMKVFTLNKKVISKVRSSFTSYISSVKVKECIGHLQSITAIPRLYRRTNKSPPKEASAYMVEAVKPVTNFAKKFEVNYVQVKDTIEGIINVISKQYLSLVQDVLRSVCKTEESLRRLKNRASNVSGDSPADSKETMSDEAKIKEQIKYDVFYFCDKLEPWASKQVKDTMDELKKEVTK